MNTVDTAAIAAFNANDPLASSMSVVDTKTGEVIAQVIEADVATGKLRRYAIENGLLVREDNAFKVIDEDRAIRIDRVAPVVIETSPASDIQSVGADA